MNGSLPLTEEELVWPSDEEAAGALAIFAASVRQHYGDRLKGLYLFGSRARGDHKPMSDADVAVVIADGDWIEWQERRALVGLAYDPTLESGMLIQPWPVRVSDWSLSSPGKSAFIRSALNDAVAIG